MDSEVVALVVAGLFAMMSCALSVAQMRGHLLHNVHTNARKHILRILFMVPVYALESYIGLLFSGFAPYADILRECYEAFVIYSFFEFLVEVLGGESRTVELLEARGEPVEHLVPFCFLTTWTRPDDFYFYCKVGTLQYAACKPVLAFMTFILKISGAYEDGAFSATNGYPYIAFLTNCSQMWALYVLVLFYLATKEALAPCSPILKFACVKSVVFFTWWQSVGLAVLVKLRVIKNTPSHSADNVVTGLQDFIVCIEMFIAAIAHTWAFPPKEQYPHAVRVAHGTRVLKEVFRVVNLSDVYTNDVKEVMQTHKKRKQEQKQRKNQDNGSEPLLPSSSSEGATPLEYGTPSKAPLLEKEHNNGNNIDDEDFL